MPSSGSKTIGGRRTRATLQWTSLTAGLAAALLGIDVALGYSGLTHGNPGEEMDRVLEPHPRLGWAPRPGDSGWHRSPGNFDVAYGIDADGLRRTWSRGTARSRIWLFGDSFSFGAGVGDDDTFASVMARDWLAPDVHVKNAGVAAYGLPQQVQRLADLEDRIEPGDLVLFTPISNDLERTLAEFRYVSRFLYRPFGGEQVENLPDLRDGELVTARLDTPGNRVRALFYHAALTGPGAGRPHSRRSARAPRSARA